MYMFNGSRCVGPCRSSGNGLDNMLEKLEVLMHFLHLDILSGKGVDPENLCLPHLVASRLNSLKSKSDVPWKVEASSSSSHYV